MLGSTRLPLHYRKGLIFMPAPTSSSSATYNLSLTGSLQVNALLYGSKWGGAVGTGATLTCSFPFVSGTATFSGPTGPENYSPLNEYLVAYGLDATEQDAARSALQAWANVGNLQFQEVADTASNVGDIRLAWTPPTKASRYGDGPMRPVPILLRAATSGSVRLTLTLIGQRGPIISLV